MDAAQSRARPPWFNKEMVMGDGGVGVSGFDWVTERAEIMEVGPRLSDQWLARNEGNRRVMERRVERFVDKMKTGKFVFNGQSISFDVTGRLIDGQHRLMAVSATGIPCKLVVVFGVQPNAAHTQDMGAKRTLEDQARRDGVVPHTQFVAKWARQYERLRSGMAASVDFDSAELAAWYTARRASVDWLIPHVPAKSNLFRAAMCAVFLRGHELYPKQMEKFVARYKSGERLSSGDPELALRESALRLTGAAAGEAAQIAEARRAAYAVLSTATGHRMTRASSSDAALKELFGRR